MDANRPTASAPGAGEVTCGTMYIEPQGTMGGSIGPFKKTSVALAAAATGVLYVAQNR